MTGRFASLAQQLHRQECPPGGAATDRQLLEQFLHNRDQAAFRAILERHGPMIRGVCQRVLGRAADADDAFQATFLVLVRRATSVGWHESLGGWLHAVACRVAHKARSNATRAADLARQAAPREVPTMPDADPQTVAAQRELHAMMDEELARLPEKYRLPLVLCYLEGQTNEEAARQLGWTKGTVSGRLARARDLVRGRLARRGVALSVAAVEVALVNVASAVTLPAPLLESTLKAVVLSLSGPVAMVEAVSARAITLTEGVSQAMTLTRLKVGIVAFLAFGLVATGTTLLTYHALAASQKEAKVEPAPRPADKPLVTPMTDDKNLQGTWTITNAESLQQGQKWTFTDGRLTKNDVPGKDVVTSYKLGPEQKPKSIDLRLQSGNDGPILLEVKGIYHLEGDELKICLAPPGEARPRAFPAGTVASVLIFKRERPAMVSLILTRASGERFERDTLFRCDLSLDNETGNDLRVRSNFSSAFDGLELVVTTGEGKTLAQQSHSFHQSPFSPPGRLFTLKKGVTTTTIVFPISDLPASARQVKVRLVGRLPGSDYERMLSTETLEVTIKIKE